VRRRQAGYTLIEILVSMAVMGVVIAIFCVLAAEMRSHEKRLPVNMLRHPQVMAVIARLRRDVIDAAGKSPYRDAYDGYTAGSQVLILETLTGAGVEMVVWDFRTPREVHRRSYRVGVPTEWIARGLPQDFQNFRVGAVGLPGRPWAVRLVAKDSDGRIAIDQILQPRAHE
jgi:prepilin-type N-terminal cleavage/methylation domain-containing protein